MSAGDERRQAGLRICAAVLAVIVGAIIAGTFGTGEAHAALARGFPASYTKELNKLKEQHPNWEFVPVGTGLDWEEAVDRMCRKPEVNTVWYSFGPEYRSTAKGCYNYLEKVYLPKDGVRFYAASPKAVKCYMDPRNWLKEDTIFMFEDQKYHPEYQTPEAVRSVFKGRNKVLYQNAGAFVKAAEKYDISAIYLAVKAMEEQGSGINSGTKGGKKVYNIFNIGAGDAEGSGSGGKKDALIFARYGAGYGRPWTSVKKAVKGGARYLAENFSQKNQNSHYLEHFNVLNGSDDVGTHVYMTAVYAPKSNARMTFANYQKYGLDNRKLIFRIPVYRNMPERACPPPSNKAARNNDFYLKSLTIQGKKGNVRLIKKKKANYDTSFSCKVKGEEITIRAVPSDENAVVTGAGVKTLREGKNTFRIKVTATSGAVRTYRIKIKRK